MTGIQHTHPVRSIRNQATVGLVLVLAVLTAGELGVRAAAPGDPEGDSDPLPTRAVGCLGTVRFRHPGRAGSLAFSPDGKFLVTDCAGDGLVFWDAATGRQVRRIPITRCSFTGRPFDFSSDGKLFAAVDPDADAIRCWDTTTGKEVRLLRCPHTLDPSYKALSDTFPTLLRFAPDGKRLAVLARDQDPDQPRATTLFVTVLDATTGKRLQRWRSGSGYSLAFSPDGGLLALSASTPLVQVWDVTTGKRAFRVLPKDPSRDWAPDIAFAPDGKTLAVGTVDRIELVDITTGKERGRLETEMKVVGGLAFTPDGKTLVSVSTDNKVRVWDVAARKVHLTFDTPPFHAQLSPLALAPDGKTLALRTFDSSVRLWDVATGRELFTHFQGHDAPVGCLAFSPDGKTLVSGSKGQTRLWDASTWKPRRLLPQTSHALSLDADGRRLALEALDQTVRVWDVVTGKETARWAELKGSEIRGTPLFAAGGKVVVVADRNSASREEVGRLTVWDTTTGQPRRRTLIPGVCPFATAVTADGKTAFLCGDSHIVICDLEAGRVRGSLSRQRCCRSPTLSPDGRLFAAVCDAPGDRPAEFRAVRLWELNSGQEVFLLREFPRGVGAVAFSPDGRLLATGSGSWTYLKASADAPEIRVWDVFTGREVGRFRGHRADTSALAFTPDGTRLVSGHEDGTLLVWDVTAAVDRLRQEESNRDAASLELLWTELAGADAGKARRAIGRFVAAGRSVVPYLRQRLRPATAVEAGWLKRRLAGLDSDDFEMRRRAFEELAERGELVQEALKDALARASAAETRKQLERLLEEIEERALKPTKDRLRELRALEVLERGGGTEARQLLQKLAEGVRQARLTREASAAVERMEKQPPAP